MRLSYPGLLVMLLWFVSSAAAAVDRLPIEDFAREPAAARARLSPDGKRLAFLREYNGLRTLFITDLDANKLSRLDLGGAELISDAPKEVYEFHWVGDERLLITTTVWDEVYAVIAVDWHGGNPVAISGYEDNQMEISGQKTFVHKVCHIFHDKDQNFLMLDDHLDHFGRISKPDIIQFSARSGSSGTVVTNPGNVVEWGLDFDGVARLGITKEGNRSGAIYRESEKSPWHILLPLEKREAAMHPLGFDAAGNQIFVSALTPEKRWTIFPLDPATRQMGEALATNAEYDVISEHYSPSIDGISLVGPKFSRKKRSLIGLRFYTETPHVKWFDPDFAKAQIAIDRAMPETVNLLAGTSKNEKRLLWFSYSDRNPGEYYLMDAEKRSVKLLAAQMNWIRPADMARMLGVKYKTRDGLLIHGYLTVPLGHQPKGLPLVVLPHGGPWTRDVWEFDPLVQLLANRGYAVLQMNYRGSPGYGEELYQNARRQIGKEIQDDIEDATRWAISSGVADPQRIAIMGASYGGYSTLFALGHNPELYRCGISLSGVTDWLAFFDNSDIAEYKDATRHWREQLGDPSEDKEFLRSISPVSFADKIVAPVLLIQGKRDLRVPQDQAKRMIAALEKAGRKPASLFLADVGHNFGSEKKRAEIFGALVDFLEKNLGPGVF